MGKDKKEKHKKEKHKKHKRARSPSTDSSSDVSDDQRASDKRHKTEKLAQKVVAHLQKSGAASGSETFVWAKKVEKEIEGGKKIKDISVFTDRHRHQERLEEIEKVRKRQAEREEEKARREEELTMVQRMRAAQEAMDSEAKEEEFYLKAMVAKAERRLREGRPAPIDMIAKNLHLLDQFDFDLVDPWKFFTGLLLDDVRDLHDEIKEYREYDKTDLHTQFWEPLTVIAEEELREAKKRDEADRALLRASKGEAGGGGGEMQDRELHPDVFDDIEGMFQGQTLGQLSDLQDSVRDALETNYGDPEYWEAVGRRLKIHMAKAKVRDIMSKLFATALKKMKQESEAAASLKLDDDLAPSAPSAGVEADRDMDDLLGDDRGRLGTSDEDPPVPLVPSVDAQVEEAGIAEESEEEEDEENDGRWSPKPVDRALISGQDIIPETDDRRQVDLLRQQVLLQEAARFKLASGGMSSVHGGTGIGLRNEARMLKGGDNQHMGGDHDAPHPLIQNLASSSAADGFRSGVDDGTDQETLRSFKAQSLRLMGNDEGERDFGGEVPMESTVYWWHDKYKPRKPKYFNRVHTGYEWNKYNQTHYDTDNPPPKVVQGYKFNILYHDLIDKSKAPHYKIERDPDSADGSTCLLRFIAGPPYEDISFRIVNKEWEYSHKRGFKCTFERGILHVYFNFERARYRR